MSRKTKRDGFYFLFPYVYVYNIIVMYSAIFYIYVIFIFFTIRYCCYYCASKRIILLYASCPTKDIRDSEQRQRIEEGHAFTTTMRSESTTNERETRKTRPEFEMSDDDIGVRGRAPQNLNRGGIISWVDTIVGGGVTVRYDVTFTSALQKNLQPSIL